MGDNASQKPTEAPSTQTEAPQPEPASPPAEESRASDPPPPADIPPIITYPEFLLRPAQPQPLLTGRGLLNATYVAGCAAGVVYCANRYVVSPMISSLAEARHSLAETALTNLSKLNSRLEQAVSAPPKHSITKKDYDDSEEAISDSEASSDSDPAELFHVDVATQTTPGLSRSSSISSASSPSQDPTTTSTTANKISTQESHLKDIHDKVSYIKLVNESASPSERALSGTLQDLSSYLTSLRYDSSHQRRNAPYANYLFGTTTPARVGAGGRGKSADNEDAVDGVRSEIRGIKGVLLSAKNFPASNPGAGSAPRREVR